MSSLSTLTLTVGLTIVILAGCASNHNLRDGDSVLDGGYQVTEVNSSIFYIYARTNAALIARDEDAKKMWAAQASRSCKGQPFLVAKLSRRLGDAKIPLLFVSEITGYAICSGSGLSAEQIHTAIEQYEKGGTP
ncbi:MAG: hypothetical protein ACYCZQ_13755 [Burkholderiales bacterium]